jgi:proteasome lid subunit RPN8/RPN11
MPNNYEQEVCNILKETAINQKLEELKENTRANGNEYIFGVCSDGNITRIFEGTKTWVDASSVEDRCNGHTDLIIHSHPGGTAYPSKGDFISDIDIPPRIANCIYGVKDDKITCFRTSDELRNKYRPLIEKSLKKLREKYIKIENAIDPEEEHKLKEEYENEYNKYKTLLTNIAKEVVLNIYPNLKSIKYPYGNEGDDYDKTIKKEPRFGNFGDVWIKDCGKI